jgi:hypothetical protein
VWTVLQTQSYRHSLTDSPTDSVPHPHTVALLVQSMHHGVRSLGILWYTQCLPRDNLAKSPRAAHLVVTPSMLETPPGLIANWHAMQRVKAYVQLFAPAVTAEAVPNRHCTRQAVLQTTLSAL